MPQQVLFVVVPLVVYLVLVSLPAGRKALIGIAVAAVVMAVVSVVGSSGGASGTLAAIGLFSGSAIAMAALVQLLRRNLGTARSVWTYPALVAAGLAASAAVIFQMIGT